MGVKTEAGSSVPTAFRAIREVQIVEAPGRYSVSRLRGRSERCSSFHFGLMRSQ